MINFLFFIWWMIRFFWSLVNDEIQWNKNDKSFSNYEMMNLQYSSGRATEAELSKKVKEFTWNSKTICLLHNENRTRIWFPVSSHYFSNALASFIVESKHTPLITKYPEFFIVIRTWMHLCIPLLKPPLYSWPLNFTLQQEHHPISPLTT